jgi:hypothetical protein
MMIYPFDYRMDNTNISKDKHQRIALVIAMIGAASLLSLGAVASTTITPAFAGGDDGVKQKAEADNDCDQKNKVEDGTENDQANEQLCLATAININELTVVGGGGIGGLFASSNSEATLEEFNPPSTP